MSAIDKDAAVPDARAGAAAAAASAAAAERLARLKGIGLMGLALICFAILDGAAKWLGRDMSAVQITFVRYAIALVLIVVVLNPWTTPGAWTTRRPGLQIWRALLLLASTASNFMAIRYLQLAEAISIAFATPFVIAALSGPLLGEWIGVRRWLAIVVGFGGVLIVTRPGTEAFQPAMLWSFANVACYAGYGLTTRILSASDSTASMLVISALIPTVLLAPLMPAIWVWPADALGWGLMLLTGIAGSVGHFFLIRSYTIAPAPVVAPFIYTQLVWATLVGWLVFGDLPGTNTILGAAVVIASGLYLIYRETVVKKQPTPPPAG